MKSKINLSHINTLDDLKNEQLALKARIQLREEELKDHFKKVPKEAFKFGVSAVVPQFLQNKATSTFFTAGRNIMGSLFAKKGEKGDVLMKGFRQAGMYFIIKQALKIFAKRL